MRIPGQVTINLDGVADDDLFAHQRSLERARGWELGVVGSSEAAFGADEQFTRRSEEAECRVDGAENDQWVFFGNHFDS
jgi:hypothetical protein